MDLKVNKIKDEINRRIEECESKYPKDKGGYWTDEESDAFVIAEEYKKLLLFIDSLTSEKSSEGLEDEIKSYFKDWSIHPDCQSMFDDIAHHFAEWQKEKLLIKACQWLNKNVVEYHPRTGELKPVVNINAFREAMEKEDE